MKRQMLALLTIAAAAGAAAHVAAHARAEAAPARIPAIAVAEVSGSECPIPKAFRESFRRAARDTGLPLALLTAVARVESQFTPQAESHAGARGLMQVMPTTASDLALDPDVPRQNILAGARYLWLMFRRFRASDLALAAHNAGPTAVARAGGAPSDETLTYVADVTAVWRALAGCR